MGVALVHIAWRAGRTDSVHGDGDEKAEHRLRQTAPERIESADWGPNDAAIAAHEKAARPQRGTPPS